LEIQKAEALIAARREDRLSEKKEDATEHLKRLQLSSLMGLNREEAEAFTTSPPSQWPDSVSEKAGKYFKREADRALETERFQLDILKRQYELAGDKIGLARTNARIAEMEEKRRAQQLADEKDARPKKMKMELLARTAAVLKVIPRAVKRAGSGELEHAGQVPFIDLIGQGEREIKGTMAEGLKHEGIAGKTPSEMDPALVYAAVFLPAAKGGDVVVSLEGAKAVDWGRDKPTLGVRPNEEIFRLMYEAAGIMDETDEKKISTRQFEAAQKLQNYGLIARTDKQDETGLWKLIPKSKGGMAEVSNAMVDAFTVRMEIAQRGNIPLYERTTSQIEMNAAGLEQPANPKLEKLTGQLLESIVGDLIKEFQELER